MPPKKKRAQPSGPSYAGEVFCFTGFRDKDLSDAVAAAGGSVANSMTKAVTCVVCKSGSESTKKVQDAVGKGLKLMTKTELEDELGGNSGPAAAPPPKKGRAAKGAVGAPPADKKTNQAAKSAAIVAASASAKSISTQVGCIDPIAEALFDNGTEVATDGADVYDVALSQIDLKKNMDKYYIIQLLVQPPKKKYDDETYYVFTRWGRTGNAGQNQIAGPFDDIEEAESDFQEKFHSKTMNDWDDRHSFVHKKSHYNLLRVDHASKAARRLAASGGDVPKWEYYVDDFVDGKPTGWYPYTADGAENTEDLWVTYQANSQMSTRVVESGTYNYEVDLVNMTQMNVNHPARKVRHIRRSFKGSVTQGANVGSSASSSSSVAVVAAQASNAVTSSIAVAAQGVSSVFSGLANALAAPTPAPMAKAKIAAAAPSSSTPAARPVDSHCPLSSRSSVRVVDDLDVMLNQADIVKNANKFYRLQVLVEGSSYHFWTRWGRVGEGGQSSLISTYGKNKDSAISDFKKKFKDKTGCKWEEDGPPYPSKSGKYEMIEMKVGPSPSPAAAGGGMSSLAVAASAPPSKLDALTKSFMEVIFDTDMFKSAMQEINVDLTRMPLGALSATQIDKGFTVLRELETLLSKKKPTAKDKAAIVSLSGNFYQVIPHQFARHQRPPPLDSEAKLSEKFDMLNTLQDIEVAQRVERVGGASLTEHPIDAKYRELAADLSILNTASAEFGIIQNFIDKTMGYRKVQLQTVWGVSRHPEDTTFSAFDGTGNHRLLWHGTNMAVVAAILKTGLRIMPAVHGGRVGRGLYFADKLEKSTGYVRPTRLSDGTQLGVLFLVEVAMGNMKEITRDDSTLRAAPAGYDSVLAKGTEEPDYSQVNTIDFNGIPVTVPAGPMKKTGVSSSFSQNEFLVYREEQQRLRYIVTFRF